MHAMANVKEYMQGIGKAARAASRIMALADTAALMGRPVRWLKGRWKIKRITAMRKPVKPTRVR